jgi:hypothetical protein
MADPVPVALRFRRSVAIAALAAGALAAALASHAGSAGAESFATSARTISISETGHLHSTNARAITINQTLNEQGAASGTITGAIYIHLRFPSLGRVSAEVNIYPRGGSLTGVASASYRSSGATASFSGTMDVIRGTGGYNGARGTGLKFSGTVQRSNDAVTVYVTGRFSS